MRKIAELWLDNYVGLSKFKVDKLYCITGPLIIGLELTKLPRVEKYRPHFVCYSLYGLPIGKTARDCLSYPLLMTELFSKTGFQFSLTYDCDIQDCVHSLNEFLTFNLGQDVKVTSFLSWLSIVSTNDNLRSRIKLPDIWELKYYISLYKSTECSIEIINEIENYLSKNGKGELFKNYGGFDFWFKELTKLSRDEILDIVCINKKDKLFRSLNQYELI